jgi:signal transduction histidine kinase/CheY-like chemotaxis protein
MSHPADSPRNARASDLQAEGANKWGSAPEDPVIEEIKRQRDLLVHEAWGRLPLTLLAVMMTTIYLPVWVAATCAALNVAAECGAMRYMRGLVPHRHPRRYNFVVFCSVALEFFYVLPAVLVWQLDANYAKAFAMGMLCITLVQMIAVRTIHMRFGSATLLGAGLPAVVGNTVFWVQIDGYWGLLSSSLALLGGMAYTLLAMQSSNHMHQRAARDRAVALDSAKAKSRFLAQMSHELRTPLNAILGMGHAELRRSTDTLAQNRLSVLIASAEGLSTILDDILDMSAIEAGRLPIRPQAVSPSAEIAATLALFLPGVTAAGLTLHQDIDAALDPVWMVDPQRLQQCLSNLLSNALKNTLRGGIHVSARTEAGAGKGDADTLLVVTVSDTGQGIPFHFHRTLFEPFVQARTPRAGTESNGLGLSISRTMARQMGGDLTIAPNAPDQSGARFILSLGLGVAPMDSVDSVDGPKPLGTAPRLPELDTAGLTVLVVDDIATNRLVASTYLRMLGAVMIEAASGAEALEVLGQTRPDLVLLDMNMPAMNGLETLAKIRALPDGAGQLPVIAMTADAMSEHRAFYLSSGVDGYLAKPINPARIEAEIHAVLGAARSV